VHHQWSDALVVRDGFQFPLTFPFTFFEWVWRPATELPELSKPDPQGHPHTSSICRVTLLA
jgi:hypothetical protein